MLKTIIIDNDRNEQIRLSGIIEEHCSKLALLGAAANVKDGLDLFEKVSPDVAFMEIMLDSELSFELLDKLPNRTCKIIFISSHKEYALNAFKYEAVDFIVKPYSSNDIINAIDKIKSNDVDNSILIELGKLFLNKQGQNVKEKLKIQTSEGIVILKSKEVVRVEANGAYCWVYDDKGKKYLASKPLKEVQTKLPEDQFYRTHASHLINIDYIKQIHTEEYCTAIMINGEQVPVSRRNKHDFIIRLMK